MALDSISVARLQLVNPALSRIVVNMAEFLEQEHITFRVTQGFRTWAEQNDLYEQGRTTPGKIVTNAQAKESWHCYGCAVDIVPMDQIPPRPDWNIEHPVWRRIIECAKSLGLYSGSDFCHFKDFPHLQLTGRFPIAAPNAEAQEIYDHQGMAAFWQEVNTA